MSNEIWPILISPAVTVLGWFVAAHWAIKQVNVAYAKNRALQGAILKQAKNDSIASKFINISIEIVHCIVELKNAINHVGLNMYLDQSPRLEGMAFAWRDKVEEINITYSNLGKQFQHLRVWVDVHGEHVPNTEAISAIIALYDNSLAATLKITESHPWIMFQGVLAGIGANRYPNDKIYTESASAVFEKLDAIAKDLQHEAKIVERYFLAPDAIDI